MWPCRAKKEKNKQPLEGVQAIFFVFTTCLSSWWHRISALLLVSTRLPLFILIPNIPSLLLSLSGNASGSACVSTLPSLSTLCPCILGNRWYHLVQSWEEGLQRGGECLRLCAIFDRERRGCVGGGGRRPSVGFLNFSFSFFFLFLAFAPQYL